MEKSDLIALMAASIYAGMDRLQDDPRADPKGLRLIALREAEAMYSELRQDWKDRNRAV